MKTLIRIAMLGSLLFLAPHYAKAQVGIGIEIGAPPRPRVVYARPVQPGPDFIWVDGYWYPVNGRYRWHRGYWTRVPYGGARWVGPRYERGRYYRGYWDGEHGRFDHDHHWDRDHDRDRDRWRH